MLYVNVDESIDKILLSESDSGDIESCMCCCSVENCLDDTAKSIVGAMMALNFFGKANWNKKMD